MPPFDLNTLGLLLGGLNPHGGTPFLRGYSRGKEERQQQQERERQQREREAQQRRQDELLRLQQSQEARAQEDQEFQRQQQRIAGVNSMRQLLEDPEIDEPAKFEERLGFARSYAPMLGVDPGFVETFRPAPDTFTKRKLTKLLNDFEKRPMSERQEAEQQIYWDVGGQKYTPAQARQTLGRGGMDARTGQPFAFTAPPQEPDTPNTTEEAHIADAIAIAEEQKGQPLTRAERARVRLAAVEEYARIRGRADDRAPAPPNTGVQDQRRFNMEQRLVSQWDKANAPMKEMRRQLGLMETGLTRFRAGDKNGGAQAVLVTFQKILDPTSVVRESEYARTAAGQSLMNRIEGFAQRLASGGAGLTDGEMAAMVTTAQDFLRGMDSFNAGLRQRIGTTAQEYQLDPRMIFDDVGAAPTAGPRPGGTVNPFRR